jgi:hypothetical protein
LKTGTTIVGLVFQVRPPTLVVLPSGIFRHQLVCFCSFRATCVREFQRHEPSCAVVCSC